MSQIFLKKLSENQITTNFIYLTSSNFETKSIPVKTSWNSGMVHFAEINQVAPPYSMLHHVGRVAKPKLVPRNCLRYLQTTLIMGRGGLVSENIWGIVSVTALKLEFFVKFFIGGKVRYSVFLILMFGFERIVFLKRRQSADFFNDIFHWSSSQVFDIFLQSSEICLYNMLCQVLHFLLISLNLILDM